MNSELQNILAKYAELDRLKDSGEDVVADLRKEINNLELAYLKDTVLPKVAITFGSLVNGLRCDIDGNISKSQDKNVEYAFGTSINMVMLKGELDSREVNEEKLIIPANETLKNHPVTSIIIHDLRIEEYSEKAIVVRGDTRQISDILNAQNGMFNFRLKGGSGWIFPKKRRAEVEDLLKAYMPINIAEKNINKEQKSDIEKEQTPDNLHQTDISPVSHQIEKIGIKSIKSGDIYLENKTESQILTDFVNAIGPEIVRLMHIEHLDGLLVEEKLSPKYAKYSFQLKDGSWINTHGTTKTKIDILNRICKRLHRDVVIELWDDYGQTDAESSSLIFTNLTNVSHNNIDKSELIKEDCEGRVFNKNSQISNSTDKWIELILNLDRVNFNGFYLPAKTLLVIAISEAIEKRILSDNKVRLNHALKNIFFNLWYKYFPSISKNDCNIYKTFVRLGDETIFDLELFNPNCNLNLTKEWNCVTFPKEIQYGILNEELSKLLDDEKFRRILHDRFKQSLPISISVTSELEKKLIYGIQKNDQMEWFFTFIQSSKINSNKYYSFQIALLLATELVCPNVTNSIKSNLKEFELKHGNFSLINAIEYCIEKAIDNHDNDLVSIFTIWSLELYLKHLSKSTRKSLTIDNLITRIYTPQNVMIKVSGAKISKKKNNVKSVENSNNYTNNNQGLSKRGFKDFMTQRKESNYNIKMRINALEMEAVKKIIRNRSNVNSIYSVNKLNILLSIQRDIHNTEGYFAGFIRRAIDEYVEYFKLC